MRRLSFLFVPILLTAIACENAETKQKDSEQSEAVQNKTEINEGFESRDLNEFDLEAEIQLPKGGTPITIKNEPTGDIAFSDGKHFKFLITPFGFTLEELKEELKSDLVYEINYIEEQSDYVVFEKTIPDSDVEKEIHFIMVKEFGGEYYEIKSSSEGIFKKHHIDKMLQSAKSFKLKSTS